MSCQGLDDDQKLAINRLIDFADVHLDERQARAILERNGWDFDRASESLLMSSEVGMPSGGLCDSSVERTFREDQAKALECGKKLETSVPSEQEAGAPLVLNFGRPQSICGDGPLVIRAEPTHTLNVEVKLVPGDNGKMYSSICCNWHVESGLSVTDIILYPWQAPEGVNPVAHKYADGESCTNGSVSFNQVERGLYDVRLYNKAQPRKPLCCNSEPVTVGPIVVLDVNVHDGRAVRIKVNSSSPDKDKKAELHVKPNDWIGLFRAEEKDNTVLYERSAYKYCSDLVDSSLEILLPRCAGKYQFRYFDHDSNVGVSSGVSEVIDYTPRDSMEALAYSTETCILRVRWSCFSREPSNWFWIGLYSDAKKGNNAKRETWNWCCKGRMGSSGEHGLLDLEVPKTLAKIVCSRVNRCWELQDLELRFYASSSELLFTLPLPEMPLEPSASPRTGSLIGSSC